MSEETRKTNTIVKHNINEWIEENKATIPPFGTTMLNNKQLKALYVSSPDCPRFFHIEEGEEFLYQKKGDIQLRAQVQGKFKTYDIREGDVFLVPGKMPHSPQRYANTLGLAIYREKRPSEKDCFRYFVEGSDERLWEKWFFCDDVHNHMGPIQREFRNSEQCQTGKPVPNTLPTASYETDELRDVTEPFSLKEWIETHRVEIKVSGAKRLFDLSYQSDIFLLGPGSRGSKTFKNADTYLWQIEGSSKIIVPNEGTGETIEMNPNEYLIIPANCQYEYIGHNSSICFSLIMDPDNKARAFEHLEA